MNSRNSYGEDSERSGSVMPNRRDFLKVTGVVGSAGLFSTTTVADRLEETCPDLEPAAPDEKPLVRVVSTGGTIASTEAAAEGSGYSLSEQADAIVESVPVLDYFVDIEFVEVAQKGSSSLLPEDFVGVAKAAREADADGADGVIVTHGTDAIEENAYFNDLVLDLDIPVAFVGAMRPADAVSADGPANLLTAVRMITRREFHLDDEPSGVYVVLNDVIHAARDVTKAHTTKVETFESGRAGPVAVFTDDELVLYREPGSYSSNLSNADLDAIPDLVVPIVTTGAGADAYPIEQAVAGNYDVDGITIQATGWWGGTSPAITEATADALDAGIPVVRSTRVHDGPLKPDDDDTSIVIMEDLPAWKARLHLMAALSVTTDLEAIRATVNDGKYATRVVAPSTLE